MSIDGHGNRIDRCIVESNAANAPPIVAPIYSDGEKMPLEEPEPRLSGVASILQTNITSGTP